MAKVKLPWLLYLASKAPAAPDTKESFELAQRAMLLIELLELTIRYPSCWPEHCEDHTTATVRMALQQVVEAVLFRLVLRDRF